MIKKCQYFVFLSLILLFLIHLLISDKMTERVHDSDMLKLGQNIIAPNKNVSVTNEKIKHIFLWAQIRSGSRFLAQLITLNFNVFYIEEPVADLYLSDANGEHGKTNVSKFLKDIMNCKGHKYPEYENMKMRSTRNNNKDLLQMTAEFNKTQAIILDLDEAICRSSKIRFGRIVVPTLNVAMPLFNDADMNPYVILLIRDPRAITESRRAVNNVNPYDYDPCSKERNDLLGIDNIDGKFSKRILILRYEDLAIKPESVTKRIYKFLNFPFTVEVKTFLDSHTKFEVASNHPFSTFRVSKNRVSSWRRRLDYDTTKLIQDKCKDVLKRMNYRIFHSKEEYLNHSIGVVL